MAKCKSCGQKVGAGERFSYNHEQIHKVCEQCFDMLMEKKGYTITVAPENYKIYVFDDGIRHRQYIPRGPVHGVLPSKDKQDIQERVMIDMLNRKLESAAKRIEQKAG